MRKSAVQGASRRNHIPGAKAPSFPALNVRAKARTYLRTKGKSNGKSNGKSKGKSNGKMPASVYPAKLFTHSTIVRTATPLGPLAIHGLGASTHATPAMSRWIHGVSSANSFRNMAAVMAPP